MHAWSGESESEERRDRRPVVEETRRRKWRWPLPSRGNQRPLQRPLRERPFDEGLFGEHYLPVLGAYVGAEGVDPAVRGRAIGAQGPLGRVYVEVVPTVGHLFATGTASPKGGRAERHGEHLVIWQTDRHAGHRTWKTQQQAFHSDFASRDYFFLSFFSFDSLLLRVLAFHLGRGGVLRKRWGRAGKSKSWRGVRYGFGRMNGGGIKNTGSLKINTMMRAKLAKQRSLSK